MRRLSVAVIILCAAGCAGPVSLEQRLLATIPAGASVIEPEWSSDGRTVAVRLCLNDEWFVEVNGKRQSTFDLVGPPVFSGDGGSLAYVGRRGSKSVMVVDGIAGPDFDEIRFLPAFRSDGGAVAYAARTGAEWSIVSGKTQDRPYDSVGAPLAGRKLAFIAAWNGKEHLVWGYGRGQEYDKLRSLMISADGSSVAYAACTMLRTGPVWRIVHDASSGPEFEDVGPPVLSADGSVVAYWAKTGEGCRVFRGKDFSSEPYPSTSQVTLSSDGQSLAFEASTPGGEIAVVNGTPSVAAYRVLWFAFSDDHHTAAWVSVDDVGSCRVISGGRESRQFDEIFPRLVFQPNGSMVACVARQGADKFVVAGETQSEPFDDVGQPAFTADGRHVVFGARKGRELWWRVMDVK